MTFISGNQATIDTVVLLGANQAFYGTRALFIEIMSFKRSVNDRGHQFCIWYKVLGLFYKIFAIVLAVHS